MSQNILNTSKTLFSLEWKCKPLCFIEKNKLHFSMFAETKSTRACTTRELLTIVGIPITIKLIIGTALLGKQIEHPK